MTSHDPQPTAEDAGFVMQTIMTFWVAPSLAMACKLALPDILAKGPLEISEIARISATDVTAIGRLINALASVGVFERLPDGRYGQTGRSALLRSDDPTALAHLVEMGMSGENFAAWNALEGALRQGKSAFELQHGVDWVAYLRDRPERQEKFAAAMAATTHAAEKAILDGWNYGTFQRAVDVGGSHATFVGGLLERNPGARGVAFDLPEAIAAGRSSWQNASFAPRLDAVAGSFFESVPEGDLYLLKQILHDWNDADAIAILRNIRKVIPPGGRVAIVEAILPADSSPHPGWGMDIVMMVTTGNRERSVTDYEKLLRAAGFEPLGLTPTASMYSVLEARPA